MTGLVDVVSKFTRVRLLERPTPIQRLRRLEGALGNQRRIRLYAKRDDLCFWQLDLAGLLGSIRSGELAYESAVLFLMTGGTPGLFAYEPAFQFL